jgi:hypothetical protein
VSLAVSGRVSGTWSLGETCFGSRCQVDGTNGDNRLLATGASQAEAWYNATVQAREVGLLAPFAPSTRAQPILTVRAINLLSALHLDPGYAPAHAALASHYQARGDTERAAFHRQQAEAHRKDNR